MPIRVICFDLDDTLWPIEPVIDYAEEQLHYWLSQYYPRVAEQFDPPTFRQLRQQLLEIQPQLSCDLNQLRKMSLAQAAAQVGYSDSLVEPAFAVFMTARHQVQLYDDVLPTLTRLQHHYRICALTNGNADVRRLGLGDWFEATFFAREIGAAKPHPALFEAVCHYTQAQPAEIVHIGDDAICDIAGAAAVGMKTVWINRFPHKIWSGTILPDAIISSLTELEPLLMHWNTSDNNSCSVKPILAG